MEARKLALQGDPSDEAKTETALPNPNNENNGSATAPNPHPAGSTVVAAEPNGNPVEMKPASPDGSAIEMTAADADSTLFRSTMGMNIYGFDSTPHSSQHTIDKKSQQPVDGIIDIDTDEGIRGSFERLFSDDSGPGDAKSHSAAWNFSKVFSVNNKQYRLTEISTPLLSTDANQQLH